MVVKLKGLTPRQKDRLEFLSEQLPFLKEQCRTSKFPEFVVWSVQEHLMLGGGDGLPQNEKSENTVAHHVTGRTEAAIELLEMDPSPSFEQLRDLYTSRLGLTWYIPLEEHTKPDKKFIRGRIETLLYILWRQMEDREALSATATHHAD